jgi:hypothetical protein
MHELPSTRNAELRVFLAVGLTSADFEESLLYTVRYKSSTFFSDCAIYSEISGYFNSS